MIYGFIDDFHVDFLPTDWDGTGTGTNPANHGDAYRG
jgi:hypothetical protein